MSKELLTILISALPVIELRGGIPLAILKWGIDPIFALILSIFGAYLPVIPILLLLGIISNWLSKKSKLFNKFFEKLFSGAEKKNKKIFDRFAGLAILIISSIPLPLFGAWSGALASFVFKQPIKKSAILIFIGTIIQGVAVLALTLGGELMVK